MNQVDAISGAGGAAQSVGEAALPRELRGVMPAPGTADFQRLEEEAAHHRVLIARHEASVTVSTLVSLGGALGFHAIVAGLVVWGLGSGWPHPTGLGSAGGAVPGGLMSVALTVPELGMESAMAPSLPMAGAASPRAVESFPVLAPLPALPPLEASASLPQVSGTALRSDAEGEGIPWVIAEPSPVTPGTLGIVRVNTPEEPGANRGSAARSFGPRPGDPAPSGEGTFALIRPGAGGSGNGGGGEPGQAGAGDGGGWGMGRGLSAADSPPQILDYDFSSIALPLQLQVRPPDRAVVLTISVLASGGIGEIQLRQSCGVGELDELIIAAVRATARFSPARRGGRTVDSVVEFSFPFRNLQ